MTKDVASLQQELERWESELAKLDDEIADQGWQEPERELAIVQSTVAASRNRILPRLKAEHDLALPALADQDAPAALAAYDGIIGEELARLVLRLEELRRELIRQGRNVKLGVEVAETLAALRILGKVVVRFGEAVELPALTRRLTTEQSAQLTPIAIVR